MKGKSPFAAALETTEDWLPHRIKLQVVAGFRLKAIENRCRRSVAPLSRVYSDGPPCFGAVATAGCLRVPVVTGGGKASVRVKEFVWPNTVIGNADAALRSTCHSMKGKRRATAAKSDAPRRHRPVNSLLKNANPPERDRGRTPGRRFSGSGLEKAFRTRLSRNSGGESASGAAKIRHTRNCNQE